MYEGFYKKPKHPIKPESVKVACIVPAYIPQGHLKDYGYYIENKLETIKMNLAAHQHYDAGVSYDLILYDNSSPDAAGADFLKAYGAIRRENFGFSFGAWKQGMTDFRDQYDFFLGTEDDIAPSRDGWLREIVQRFFSAPDVGAVGSFVEGRSSGESLSPELWELMKHQHDMMYNLDGAFTFTSKRIIEQVEKIGGFPLVPCGPGSEYRPNVNECIFQQPILQLGYRIISFDDGEHCPIHGSEVFTGDIQYRDKPLGPLTNINGRHHIPKVAKNYEWYKDHYYDYRK